MEVILAPLDEAAQTAALASLTVELRFLLDNFGLSQAVQAKLASLGYTEVDIFAKLEDSPAQVRAALGSDVLDPTASAVNRAVTARILAAWEAAGVRVRKRLEADADRKVGDLPRVLPKSSVLELVIGPLALYTSSSPTARLRRLHSWRNNWSSLKMASSLLPR
eukprot:4349035-Amphidinium_carterae.1